MIEVKMNFSSFEEMMTTLGGARMAQVEVTKSVPSLQPTELKPEPPAPVAPEVKPKRTRKRKAKVEEVEHTVVPTEEGLKDVPIPPMEPSSGLTKEDARAALDLVCKKVGFQDARSLLARFKVSKLSELPVEQYKEFFDACEKALPDG
jgi:hypothetical protein